MLEEKVSELEGKATKHEKRIAEQDEILQSLLTRVQHLEEKAVNTHTDDDIYPEMNYTYDSFDSVRTPIRSQPRSLCYEQQALVPPAASEIPPPLPPASGVLPPSPALVIPPPPPIALGNTPPSVMTSAVLPPPPAPGIPPPLRYSSSRYSSSNAVLYSPLPNNNPHSSVPCLPIKMKDSNAILPSSSIDKEKLSPAGQVLLHYPKLQTERKLSKLAVKLACESFFGEEIMAKCTVMGFGRYPALPATELSELKQTLFALFPKYWSNPVLFESVWKECAEAIGQACKRLQAELEKKTVMTIN